MMQEVPEADKKLTEYDECDRCLKPCNRKSLLYYARHGFICKDCRIELGFEKDERWSDPFDGTWSSRYARL